MKCSKETENKARKFVGVILGLVMIALLLLSLVYFPIQTISLLFGMVCGSATAFMIIWLLGEFNFCKEP